MHSANLDPEPPLCDQCLQANAPATALCPSCLRLLCSHCRDAHSCSQTEQIQIPEWSSYLQAAGRLGSVQSEKAYCDRCCHKLVRKKCIDCKKGRLCQPCFQLLHDQTKLSSHRKVEISSNEAKAQPLLPIPLPGAMALQFPSSRPLTLGVPSSSEPLFCPPEHQKILQSHLLMLNALLNHLELQSKSVEASAKEALLIVKRQLGCLSEQVRLKEEQLTTILQQQLKSEQEVISRLLTDAQQLYRCQRQLHSLLQAPQTDPSLQLLLQKLHIQGQQVNQLCKQQETIIDPHPLLPASLLREAEQLRDRISQLSLMRTVGESCKNTGISVSVLSPRRSYNEPKQKAKSSKNVPLIASCKSSDKLSTLFPDNQNSNLLLIDKTSPLLLAKKTSSLLSPTVSSPGQHSKPSTLSLLLSPPSKPALSKLHPRRPQLSQTQAVLPRLPQEHRHGRPQTKVEGGRVQGNPEGRGHEENKLENKGSWVQECVREDRQKGQKGQKGERGAVGRALRNIEKTKRLIEQMRLQMSDLGVKGRKHGRSNTVEMESELEISSISIQSFIEEQTSK